MALLVNTLLVLRLSLLYFYHLCRCQSLNPSTNVQKFAKNHVPKSEMPTTSHVCYALS